MELLRLTTDDANLHRDTVSESGALPQRSSGKCSSARPLERRTPDSGWRFDRRDHTLVEIARWKKGVVTRQLAIWFGWRAKPGSQPRVRSGKRRHHRMAQLRRPLSTGLL